MLEKELQELDLLLGNGGKLNSGNRQIQLQRMNLGRILSISREAIQMHVDEEALTSQDLADITREQYQAVTRNTERCAKIVALASTPAYQNEDLIKNETARILEEMTPKELNEAFVKIIKTADLTNFITSIFLMNGNRITRPQAREVEA